MRTQSNINEAVKMIEYHDWTGGCATTVMKLTTIPQKHT